MKKIISLLTALSLMFGAFGIFAVFAEDMPPEDIIEISSLAELENFRNQVNGVQSYEGKTVVLTADIDMSATYGENKKAWTPIGYSDRYETYPFKGTFDGRGHRITNLYVSVEENSRNMGTAGLFGLNSGTVRNLFVHGEIRNTLDGGTGGIAGNSVGKIENCAFTGKMGSMRHVGGIAGVNGGAIIDCYNTSNLNAAEQCGGGIAGTNDGGTIARCLNVGKVSIGEGITDEFFGSIAGYGSAESITDCYYLEGTYTRGVYTGTENDAAVSLTKDQLNDQTNFASWDFDNVWAMDTGTKMPELRTKAVPETITEIYTAQDLKKFRDSVNSDNTYEGETVRLMADIELNISEAWMPIGGVCYLVNQKNETAFGARTAFSGIFDGQGHTISGINASECLGSDATSFGSEYQGFFGCVEDGAVRNLTVTGMVRDGAYLKNPLHYKYIGGAVAYAEASNIENVHSYMDIALTETAAGYGYIGGVAAELQDGSHVFGCTNHGSIVILGNTLKSHIGYPGGVIGDMSNWSYAEECVNYGSITLRGNTVAGGVCGLISEYNSLLDCANHGKITVTADGAGYIGGIVGRVHGRGDADVQSCLNTGKMICASACVGGGIVGSLSKDDIPNIINNYYLDTSIDENAESNNQGDSIAKTAEELAAGEVAYLLNGSTSEGELKWYQNIGEDIYPVLDNTHAIVLYDGTIYYNDKPIETHKHKICSDTACADNHEEIEWTAWDSADALPEEAGNYYLTKDVEISASWRPADGTVLCLDGHSIRQANVRQSVINPRGTFSLCDCVGDGAVTGGALGVSLMGEGQVFNMYGGKITGNHFEGGVFEGGGVVCLWGSAFNMYGGEISSNSSDSVGGVKMYGQMSIGGKAVIKDNTDAGGITANLFLSSDSLITVASPLTEGAYIGIAYYPALMRKIPQPITGSNDADYSKYFHSDNKTYKIINDENNALQFVFKNNSYPYYEIKEVFATDAEYNRLNAIPANTEFTAYGYIEQIAGLEGTDYGTVVIAAYDEQGALIDVGIKDITNLEYFPCSYTADLKSGEKPVSSIKVFVWDMLHAMQPLAAANSQTFTEE